MRAAGDPVGVAATDVDRLDTDSRIKGLLQNRARRLGRAHFDQGEVRVDDRHESPGRTFVDLDRDRCRNSVCRRQLYRKLDFHRALLTSTEPVVAGGWTTAPGTGREPGGELLGVSFVITTAPMPNQRAIASRVGAIVSNAAYE